MAVESSHVSERVSSFKRDGLLDDDPTLELVDPTSELEPMSVVDVTESTAGVTLAQDAAPAGRHGEPFSDGQVLRDRYRIEAAIGFGGFCIVYRARDLRCETNDTAGAHVAIKALRPEFARSGAAIERLRTEFRRLRQLSHPNVLRVFDLDCDGDTWFQVMELLDGQSVAELLRDRGASLPELRRRLHILSGCAEALAAAHDQGVVHGDVKPGNIMVTSSGSVRLLDFGAASVEGNPDGAQVTGTGSLLATPAYASPEVLSGLPAEARDDLFSLACVGYELLAGVHPFSRLNALEARAHGLQPAEMAGLDSAVVRALGAGLAWNREDRPATVNQWFAMLAGDHGNDSQAVAESQPVVQPLAPQRLPWSSVPSIGVILAAIAAAAVLIWLVAGPEVTPGGTRPLPAAPEPGTPAASAIPAAKEADQAPETVAFVPDTPVAESSSSASPTPNDTDRDGAVAVDAAPVPVQSFSFAAESLTVSRAATSAALRLRRQGPATGRAQVSWRIVDGTARAGRDFTGPTAGRLVFADRQTLSTLFVPLLRTTTETGDATFSVEIDQVGSQARVGEVPRITVQLRQVITGADR
jgi:hypothetical protein